MLAGLAKSGSATLCSAKAPVNAKKQQSQSFFPSRLGMTVSGSIEPMNIFFLTPWYPTKDHRYAGVFVREYAKALRPHCNVLVLHCGLGDRTLPHWWSTTREFDEELTAGITSYRVWFRPSRIPLISFIRHVGSVYRAVAALSKQDRPPDLIHAHVFITGWAALLTGKLRRIPVVISEHWTAFPRGILTRSQLWQARSIFRIADAVLPVSHALQRSLERHGVKSNFQVIPNVVDTELFKLEPRSSGSSRILSLLAVSSLFEHKGLEVLFRALKEVAWQGREWRLDVVGDGPDAARCHLAVREMGLAAKVTFHGQLDKEDIARMMQHTDLFVLPSLFETFSVAAAEALASGIPVVVTRCGGPEEFVTERSGAIVAPGDAGALAEALTKTINRLPTFERAVIAREAREQFGPSRVGAMLHEVYTKLTDDRSETGQSR